MGILPLQAAGSACPGLPQPGWAPLELGFNAATWTPALEFVLAAPRWCQTSSPRRPGWPRVEGTELSVLLHVDELWEENRQLVASQVMWELASTAQKFRQEIWDGLNRKPSGVLLDDL